LTIALSYPTHIVLPSFNRLLHVLYFILCLSIDLNVSLLKGIAVPVRLSIWIQVVRRVIVFRIVGELSYRLHIQVIAGSHVPLINQSCVSLSKVKPNHFNYRVGEVPLELSLLHFLVIPA
jgi:hypothetical protein